MGTSSLSRIDLKISKQRGSLAFVFDIVVELAKKSSVLLDIARMGRLGTVGPGASLSRDRGITPEREAARSSDALTTSRNTRK